MADKVSFPNETSDYRTARQELLEAEMSLRAEIERVAVLRRKLPVGGALKEDYVFDELVEGKARQVRFSELFGPERDTLFIYNLMYGPNMKAACPACTSLLDGINGHIPQLNQRIATAVVAKRGLADLQAHADARGWSHLRLLSSANNNYNIDYHGEKDGQQMPMANIFVRDDQGIHHRWGTEMLYAPGIDGGHARHMDLAWPLWQVLDMTPSGRGDWFPSVYDGSNE
ncbi:MAG TPA: DUF899 domain-containing protein [Rhodospirillaceae bacterium]|nr:hypothetical protein [Rhodospirillaceae bacterium]HAA93055.1 DUF899 domain-containing protein [Rhodospirillaceae bacterium]HAT34421.1 DUF899 domain-containing protein [Rhodospirillaceae bacterium]